VSIQNQLPYKTVTRLVQASVAKRNRAMLASLCLAIACSAGAMLKAAETHQAPAGASEAAISQNRALLTKYCAGCHSAQVKTADVVLERADLSSVGEHAELWEKVVWKLRTGSMPPAGMPRPDAASSQALAAWLEAKLDAASVAHPNPGRTEALHRLNRNEYQNAIKDLLALDIDATGLLPADDASYGFDNMAGVLRISPVLMERYASAAEKISRVAVGSLAIAPTEETVRVPSDLNQDEHIDGLPFGTRGGTVIHYTFPLDAEYAIKVRLARNYTDSLSAFVEPHQIEVSVDGQRVQMFTIGQKPPDDAQARSRLLRQADQSADAHFDARVPVKAGPHDVEVAFIKKDDALLESPREPFVRPSFGAGGDTRLQPYIGSVTVAGPFDAKGPGDTPSRRRILICKPANAADEQACASKILSTLARRAYRRPVTRADLDVLLDFYKDGRQNGSFEYGIEMAVRRLLVSPSFLFRIERDPANAAPGTPYRISDLELASRLSFFLWSSIPDDQLLDLAIQGRLKNPVVLREQVRRMLADPRSQALVTNFTGQWLYLRNIPAVTPDSELFPDFDYSLRDGFRRETELFFGSILHENRSVLDLLTARYTFLNERLAKHYGIPDVYGPEFRKVALSDGTRGGLLAQGSILTVTSYANRTSPVIRGKWLLENLLGSPPPPPPPNVPSLKENKEGEKALSVRERLEEHRANPACASCHKIMDPLGFALENFDAVGQWRSNSEAGTPIDASGVLSDGTKVDGPASLRQALLSHPDAFAATVTGKLLTYALGRGLEYYDQPAIRKIRRDAAQSNSSLSAIILGIVQSAPFEMRRSQL
jgi:mono/diheme cytochrome c family protein